MVNLLFPDWWLESPELLIHEVCDTRVRFELGEVSDLFRQLAAHDCPPCGEIR